MRHQYCLCVTGATSTTLSIPDMFRAIKFIKAPYKEHLLLASYSLIVTHMSLKIHESFYSELNISDYIYTILTTIFKL